MTRSPPPYANAMTTTEHLTYRGEIQALAAFQNRLALVTLHAESQATPVYLLDAEKMKLDAVELPTGGRCLLATDESLIVGGADGKLYQLTSPSDSARALPVKLPAPATCLAALSDNRVAAICESAVVIVSPRKKQPLQCFALEDQHGVCIASSPDGNWLAVGASKGLVAVYECEGRPEFAESAAAKLHDGAVTALLFEPEELRFFSAGADQKLLLTHARGELQPEDRGRGNSHTDAVTGMMLAPGERFITASEDGSCKTWARAGATRPATLSDGVPTVTAAAMLKIHHRDHLVLAGKDNALRFIVVDAGGRFGALNRKVYGAYARAQHMLQQDHVATRGEALSELSDYDDKRSIGMLADCAQQDVDRPLRLRAAQLLAASQHSQARMLLEPLLQHQDEDIRQLAFDGLYVEKDDLRPLELALKAGHADVGVSAVEALRKLAKKNELARQVLIGALDRDPRPVRLAAMLALESIFPKHSAEPTLIATRSQHAETQRLALLRAHQRGLLDDPQVISAVRRATADTDADNVRHTAVLVSMLSKPALAKAVRERDPEIHRQLFELEHEKVQLEETAPDTKGKSRGKPPKLKPTKLKLSPSDYEPLLSAMASRVADTSLAGARGLAVLGDARAFGALLQLSREPSALTRVEVCRAFGALGDSRAAQRLASLVNDSQAAVRDAAYSALEAVYDSDPWAATAAGLASSQKDVRRRALQTLAGALKKKKGKANRQRGESLMLLALNDDAAEIRGEAFKSTLGFKLGGGEAEALRFSLRSAHASVRNEVLTEAMANHKHAWAHELLLELLSDADPQLRKDAYDQLLKPSRGRDIAPMRAGLQSKHPDIRHAATLSLIQLQTQEAQAELIRAIDDDDAEVRSAALKAMMAANAVEVLHQAMESRYADVRIDAAAARALFRDERARQPLLDAALAEKPENEAEQDLWQQRAVKGVRGLGQLGDPSLIGALLPLLESPVQPLRQEAASALVKCAHQEQREQLLPALSHADPDVRCRIAVALALCHEPLALPIIFSQDGEKHLEPSQRFMTAVACGADTETQLAGFLDSKEAWIRTATLLVLLFRDWLQSDGTPRRILLAFSAEGPRARLDAARALEAFLDSAGFAEYLHAKLNDRPDLPAWTLPLDSVRTVAESLAFGSPQLQAQTALQLEELVGSEQHRWDFRWRVHQLRWAAEIEAAKELAASEATAVEAADPIELSSLAFGAYVGLVREQAARSAGAVAVRQAAIRRLAEMAVADPDLRDVVRPVIIQALSDDNQQVRLLAFGKLADLQLSPELQAEAAIESGRNDLAIEGLTLLASAKGDGGQKILEQVITTRSDGLSLTAATLLRKMSGTVAASAAGLESPNAGARIASVRWLAEDYDSEPKAKAALAEACQSRDTDVRVEAALALTRKRDSAAFPVLLRELQDATLNSRIRKQLLRGLVQLGDPRGADALLDFLERDSPTEPAAILGAVGDLHHTHVVPRLLDLLDKRELCQAASAAILEISGHLQPIYDRDEENDIHDSQSWLEQQRPRHDPILADYLQRLLDVGLTSQLADARVIAAARWSQSNAVDEPLAAMAFHPEASVRLPAVEAIGWRLRKRSGPADKLVELLEHRDVATKFAAAVGLAKGQRDEGLSLLLSAVELMSDLDMRVQAVEALGALDRHDSVIVDLLLKLASDDQHALQTAAAEAIGRLGDSDHADEILALLERLTEASLATANRAVIGLRWLDTPAAWSIVRKLAKECHPYCCDTAVQQLGYNDDPATRALLLELLREGDIYDAAATSARRLFGMNSIEPDLAIVASECYDAEVDAEWEREGRSCWSRICAEASAEQILDALESADTDSQTVLGAHLLQSDPLPLDAANEKLTSTSPSTIGLAAQIVGRGGESRHATTLQNALDAWLEQWQACRRNELRGDWNAEFVLPERGQALGRIIWAFGQVDGSKTQLLQLLEFRQDDAAFDEHRCAALDALAGRSLTAKECRQVAQALSHPATGVRQRAAELLAAEPKQWPTLAEAAVADWLVFQQLPAEVADESNVLAESVTHPHRQAIVLPWVVEQKETERLTATAGADDLAESTRLGAIEALAWMGEEAAEACLAELGADEQMDEELRKAAWRGLRRSKRQRARKREDKAKHHG